MRGSAQLIPGRPEMAAFRAAWEGLSCPVHPGQEEALPLVGSPAQGRAAPCTQGRRVRPLGTRAQGALLPETPARRVGSPPSAHPPLRMPPMTSGTEKRARDRHITIRLSAEERARLDDAAERAGLTTGSYARQLLLGAPPPRQSRRPPVERRELAKLLGELGKIGSNLNQLAKATNQGLVVYHNEILVALGGLRVVREAILKALGREP